MPTSSQALIERERIRRHLLAASPELRQRLSTGPSGSLVIDLPGDDGVEIGRLPRGGEPRWVVVARNDGYTRIEETPTPEAVMQVVRSALGARGGQPRRRASVEITCQCFLLAL